MKINDHNLIFTLDSYKQLHDNMYEDGTEVVYAYFESRAGAKYDYTKFFGLQYILKHWLEGVVVTKELIDEAEPILKEHFKFNGDVWKRDKWDYIANNLGGKLPLKICAVAEGKICPVGSVLMTIENTDSNCFWLTNAMETVLQQVWHATTVCTRSHLIMTIIKDFFKKTVDDDKQWLSDFYLHDFSQRGVSGMEEAGVGSMSHLVNAKGTDSLMAIPYAINYYNANIDGLAYSVPATEHSIATSLGKDGEFEVTKHLIEKYPNGILSVVSDSYDIENAVKVYCNELKELIMGRNGKFIVRPDSPRFKNDTPEDQVLWIAKTLWCGFGGTINSKGYKVLDSHVGIIYGDSLTENNIKNILVLLEQNGFSAETSVFGCGSYLVRKLNRDTERFAIKCSAQKRNGRWYDIYKNPKDASKSSKQGRFLSDKNLHEVFLDGVITKEYTFDQIKNLSS
jgi:nicotinamide phosphoribosyltransferase